MHNNILFPHCCSNNNSQIPSIYHPIAIKIIDLEWHWQFIKRGVRLDLVMKKRSFYIRSRSATKRVEGKCYQISLVKVLSVEGVWWWFAESCISWEEPKLLYCIMLPDSKYKLKSAVIHQNSYRHIKDVGHRINWFLISWSATWLREWFSYIVIWILAKLYSKQLRGT